MPENFTTLILPSTIPREEVIRQLLLYFDRVFLYSPTEEPSPSLPPEFAAHCRHEAPAALGHDLAGFRQLIRDMTSHRSEYYGGGLSRISAATQVDEESVRRLIASLVPRSATPDQDGPLVQARLLLALAEVRDREEREIASTLARIDGQGQAMLRGLTSEEDGDDEELAASMAGYDRPQASDTLAQRLWAWSHLFLKDPRAADHWLVTTTPEVMAVMADLTSTRIDEAPFRLLSLPLAGEAIMVPSPEAYLRERNAWRKEAAPCLDTLASALKDSARSGSSDATHAIQGAIPWGEKGGGTLDLYLLPLSLADLMAKIAKRPAPALAGLMPHGLVAVLNR